MKISDYMKQNPDKCVIIHQMILGIYLGINTGMQIYFGSSKNIPANLHKFEIKHIRKDYILNIEHIYF